MSEYDPIAEIYDEWISADLGDIEFYVTEAQRSGGPVLELGVGTGRVAIPTAQAGIQVIGVDASEGMLSICRSRAQKEGVLELVDLRVGDFRDPPVEERVPLVTAPFRALSHLLDESARREGLAAAFALLRPGGKLVFDVATPLPEQLSGDSLTWEEREAGSWERAQWDWNRRLLNIAIRRDKSGTSGETVLQLAWVTREEWREALESVGFRIRACYGWFDRRPCTPGGHTIWVATRPT